jgi:hypothetical protein
MIISIMQGMVNGAANAGFNGAKAGAAKLEPILKEKMKPLIEPCVLLLASAARCQRP